MQLGMVGLGRMGANMTKRLADAGHDMVVFDLSEEARQRVEKDAGAAAAASLDDLVGKLSAPRAVWIMVPSGDPTTQTIDALEKVLESGDTIIDGGNSNFHHAMATSARLSSKGLSFIDAGVSGGVWGLEYGYCLMVGGDEAAVKRVEPIFLALAPENGYSHVGPSGAGHYVKMVHNGIEYGMLQAYAEGFALLDAAHEFSLDLHDIASLWRQGSVVRSWLLDLAERALSDRKEFDRIKGYVEDSGEGRWTVNEAIDRAVPLPVITASLFARFASRQADPFDARFVAALRNQFGGHRVFEETDAASS